MRSRIPLLALVVFLSPVSRAADLQTALQAKYDAISKAFIQKDLTLYEKMLSPSFVLVGQGGRKTDRKTVISDLKRQMGMMSDVTWNRTAGKPVVDGATAVSIVKSRLKGNLMLDGKSRAFDLRSTTMDYWVKNGSGWLLRKSEVQAMGATLDGRPMNRA